MTIVLKAGMVYNDIPYNLLRTVKMESRASITDVVGGVSTSNPERRLFYEFSKRVFDIVFSLLFLVLSAPIILICGLIMQLETPGPLFYLQKRVGLNGRIFHVVKLRSMPIDAENNGPMLSKNDNDGRVGRIGHFIRKSKIDELTQFVNVLIGQMSVVGPRPERPYFVNKFIREFPEFNLRHTVKPGITGLAQFKEMDAFQVANKLRLDLFYIEHRSFGFDMKIALHTFFYCMSSIFDAVRHFNSANGNGSMQNDFTPGENDDESETSFILTSSTH